MLRIMLRFRLRVTPDWDFLASRAAARAQTLGLTWPRGLAAIKIPRTFALTLVGEVAESGAADSAVYDVMALEPPREYPLHKAVRGLHALEGSYGSQVKKALESANPGGVTFPKGTFSVRLDAHGLALPAVPAEAGKPALPEERLAAFSVSEIVALFAAAAAGVLKIKHVGTDHIVDKYETPPALTGLSISRWRGDVGYRLASAAVRLEIAVERPS